MRARLRLSRERPDEAYVLRCRSRSAPSASASWSQRLRRRSPAPQLPARRRIRRPRVRPVSASTPASVADPIVALIATSERHFEAGQQRARARPSRAGARSSSIARSTCCSSRPTAPASEPRLREHFDRLVDRISAYEMTALAQGDGFAEKKSEPASIDELLAMSHFERRRAAAGAAATRSGPTSQAPSTTFRFRSTSGCCRTSSCSRAGCATSSQDGLERGSTVPADDPERVPRRRAAARPRLHSAHRERVQAERAVARQGQGRVAVHARHRRSRTASSTTGTSTSAPIPRRPRSRRRST